jgi:hypothetical protein
MQHATRSYLEPNLNARVAAIGAASIVSKRLGFAALPRTLQTGPAQISVGWTRGAGLRFVTVDQPILS